MVLLTTMLSACGCVRDSGDSASPGDYISGCWSQTKEKKADTYVFPREHL